MEKCDIRKMYIQLQGAKRTMDALHAKKNMKGEEEKTFLKNYYVLKGKILAVEKILKD